MDSIRRLLIITGHLFIAGVMHGAGADIPLERIVGDTAGSLTPLLASSPTAAEKDLCSICHDDLKDNLSTLPCKHRLHTECYEGLINSRLVSEAVLCPLCRADVGIKGQNQPDVALRVVPAADNQVLQELQRARERASARGLRHCIGGLCLLGAAIAIVVSLNYHFQWIQFGPTTGH